MIKFAAMPSVDARAFRDGRLDANGQPPERQVSDGDGNPCRHCLDDIAAGEEMLVLSYRPLASLQPYSEVGPVFLHARACTRHEDGAALPPVLARRPMMLIRGYGRDERIVGGTGTAIPTAELVARCTELLDDARVAHVHVRSATNGCYQCRVERA
jgi:hypothetical protein